MTTLSDLVTAIDNVIQDDSYLAKIPSYINQAMKEISGGVRMSANGQISPPLPDLYAYSTVTTSTTLPYVSMPDTYQRKVFRISDSSGDVLSPPMGGDYYSFALFMKQIADLRLTEAGSIYRLAVKGNKLYYQGIPTAAETIYLHFYRKPVDMALDGDVPDGLPDHLALRLLKHKVCAEIFGEALEDGQDNSGNGVKYHTAKFYEAMIDLVDFIGIDGNPEYYGGGDFIDGGVCD
ncbi:MAG TPA: hypothetical protein PLS57_04360 [Smithellaceae bacterium]|nr:hypothetical protein [Smithellaceae bacterium]